MGIPASDTNTWPVTLRIFVAKVGYRINENVLHVDEVITLCHGGYRILN